MAKRQRCKECGKLFANLGAHARVHKKKTQPKTGKEHIEEQLARPKEEVVAEAKEVLRDSPRLPVVDNSQVVEILETGHTPTHYHCRCSDGTTRHVRKDLF